MFIVRLVKVVNKKYLRRTKMVWTIIMILLVMWLIGSVTSNTFGGVLHLLLLVALAVFVFRLFTGRRVT
jgi:hypothetical protein